MKIAVSGYKCLNDINEFVEIKSITLITGKNSSGKTSFSEAYEFLTVFMNLKRNLPNFFEWFKISITPFNFPNYNKFNQGINAKKNRFSYCIIPPPYAQKIIINFVVSNDGNNITLESIEILVEEEPLIKIMKNNSYEWGSFHELSNSTAQEFLIDFNLEKIISKTKDTIERVIRISAEYINKQSKDADFNDWYEERFFTQFNNSAKKSKADLIAFPLFFGNINNHFDLIHEHALKNNEFDIRNEAVFQDLELRSTILGTLAMNKHLDNTTLIKKVINLFDDKSSENLIIETTEFVLGGNFGNFTLSAENQKLFSETEIEELQSNWTKTTAKTNKSVPFFHPGEYNKISDSVNSYLGTHIDKSQSAFPQSNFAFISCISEQINNFPYTGNNIQSEIWHHASLLRGINIQNIWESYLLLEHGIYQKEVIINSGSLEDAKEKILEIKSENPTSFSISLALELIGQDIITKLTTDQFVQRIDNHTFGTLWSDLSYKQKVGFIQFYRDILVDVYLKKFNKTDPIFFYTSEYELTFKADDEFGNVKIALKDKSGKIVSFDDIGSGHSNFIGVILTTFYLIYISRQSKDDLLLILVEPESFLHPNMLKNLTAFLKDIDYVSQDITSINMPQLGSVPSILIETHSEYLIRNIQELIAFGKMRAESLCINYFEQSIQLEHTNIKQINILKDGSLSEEFGTGFLDETEMIIRNILNARLK